MIARATETWNRKKRFVVLSFGAGQDSTAILYKLIYDEDFRAAYAPDGFIVIMSDTGNEHPRTMLHVAEIKTLCELHRIEFYHLTPDMGYHPKTWPSLIAQYERNSSIGMKGAKYNKLCTSNLKIEPIYRFLSAYLADRFGFENNFGVSKSKAGLVSFAEAYGKIEMIIGIAAGEERRIEKVEIKQAWMRNSVERIFPLIDIGYDRQGCQNYIRRVGHRVPPPSNCMICHFLSLVELLWLYRSHPDMYHKWVQLEKAKLAKDAKRMKKEGKTNGGVFGKKRLPEALLDAINKHGHMTDEELNAYKQSHGHCVQSQY